MVFENLKTMNSNQSIQNTHIVNYIPLIVSSWSWTFKLEHKQNCITGRALVNSLKKIQLESPWEYPWLTCLFGSISLSSFWWDKTLYFQKALRMTEQSILFSIVLSSDTSIWNPYLCLQFWRTKNHMVS